KTTRFSSTLTYIHPPIEHHISAFLQLTGSTFPYREMDIAGKTSAQIDVLHSGPGQELYLLVANAIQVHGRERSQPVLITAPQYAIRISVFPVAPNEGSRDERSFTIIRDGADKLVMIDLSSFRAVGAALFWIIIGIIPYFIGRAALGVPGSIF